MDYEIAQAGDSDALVTSVQEKIAEGWEPHGELLISEHTGTPQFIQAVIKKDQAPPSGLVDENAKLKQIASETLEENEALKKKVKELEKELEKLKSAPEDDKEKP